MPRLRHSFPAAVFIVLLRGGSVCLLRRTGADRQDGRFSLPEGGVEAGETPRGAAIREAREEVGVEFAAADLRYAHTLHARTGDEEWTGHFFVAIDWAGEPGVRAPERHDDLRWVPLVDLPHDIVPYVRQALAAIADGDRYSEFGCGMVAG